MIFDDFEEYTTMIARAMDTVDQRKVQEAADVLVQAAGLGDSVLIFGNGGSAAISEHFSCDHTKGIRHDTSLKSSVVSLSSNLPLISAIANDYSYDQVFSKQVEWHNQTNAVALAISSSGNSPNIVNALKTANWRGYRTIALVGFDGGEVLYRDLASTIIHVPSYNYGVVEDCHQMIMHILAQYIRKSHANNPDKLRL